MVRPVTEWKTTSDCSSTRACNLVALATRFGLYVHGVDPAPDNVEKAQAPPATSTANPLMEHLD